MECKDILDEDFVNYKKPSMFISLCYCDWKCCIEQNLSLETCQNSPIYRQKNINIPINILVNRYINNKISQSVVFGGLEPMLQFDEIYEFICQLRNKCDDEVIIYTGYYKNEIQDKIVKLSKYKNIIIKYGRFIPNNKPHYDNTLGVYLASDNQYAERIS